MTVRVFIPDNSRDTQTYGLALGYAVQICGMFDPPLTHVVLITHTNGQLDKWTSLNTTIGDARAKLLIKGQSFPVNEGISVSHETGTRLPMVMRDAVVIVCYAEDRLLEKVDGIAGVAGVVVVPDSPSQATAWVRRWNPTVHGQAPAKPAAVLADPVVERALTELTATINRSTGIGHPRDRELADHTFRILRAKNHVEDADNVRSWAIKNGWKPGDAKDLGELAGKIFALKAKPRLSGIGGADQKYARWCG